jgi:hypothetical protein
MMSDTTMISLVKVKALDQKLEDFAGEEFDEFYDAYNDSTAGVKHYATDEDISAFDEMH